MPETAQRAFARGVGVFDARVRADGGRGKKLRRAAAIRLDPKLRDYDCGACEADAEVDLPRHRNCPLKYGGVTPNPGYTFTPRHWPEDARQCPLGLILRDEVSRSFLELYDACREFGALPGAGGAARENARRMQALRVIAREEARARNENNAAARA